MNRTGAPHRSHASTPGEVIGIAIIGCGYVADFYLATLPNHPVLGIRGCYDNDATRANIFAKHHQLRRYSSLEEVLSDPAIKIVVNLTDPASLIAPGSAAPARRGHMTTSSPSVPSSNMPPTI